MELIVSYLTGIVLLVGMFAWRVPHENSRVVFTLALLWPLSFTAILFMVILNATGWDLDVAQGIKLFGFRRPTNPKTRGFAITIFFVEVQFWKAKKA